LLPGLQSEEISRFRAIFGVVERWIEEGDRYVREAATVGLLEDLQNLNLHKTTRPDDFLQWLGPKGRHSWHMVDLFWRTGTLIRDI
jgi:hypothetical protein